MGRKEQKMSIEKSLESRRTVKVVIAMLTAMLMLFSLMPMGVYAAKSAPGKAEIKTAKSINHNTVEITWKKMKSAEKYQVYRAKKKDGKYKKVKTTKKTIFENDGLKTGQKYYYKVRAVNSKGKGDFSKIKAVTPKLNKIGKLKPTKTLDGANLTWTEIEGAHGYQVYRYNPYTEKYGLVDIVKKPYYFDPKAKEDSTRKYKIRAYKEVTVMKTMENGKKQEVSRTRYGKFAVFVVKYDDIGTVISY